MQARGRGSARPAVGIAFEGDLGTRIDAVMAAAMLNGLAAKGQSRTIAFSVSRASIKTAQLADVLVGFYSGRPVGGAAMIGMPEGRLVPDDAPPLTAVLAKTSPDGSPLYTSNIKTTLDTADNAVLMRNMLLAQVDGNATIVLAGPATGLVRLLRLYGAGPQIEAKVGRIVVAVGAFGAGGAVDASVKADIAAARTLFAEWPTPIVVVGAEVGAEVPYPASSIEADLAWSPAHPVADTYRVGRAMPYDAPSTALAAVLYAAQPDEGYFTLSEPGTVSVLADGRTQFTAAAGGRHRRLMIGADQKARVLQAFTELVSARPAPRPGRRGGPPPVAAPPPPVVAPVAPATAKPSTP